MVRDSWRRTLAIGLAFVVAVAGAFLFGMRAQKRAHALRVANEPIHAWMSIPFIAHTHHVPVAVLFQAIGVEPHQPRDRRSVRRIAHEIHKSVPEVIAQLEHAIQETHPPGGPPR